MGYIDGTHEGLVVDICEGVIVGYELVGLELVGDEDGDGMIVEDGFDTIANGLALG